MVDESQTFAVEPRSPDRSTDDSLRPCPHKSARHVGDDEGSMPLCPICSAISPPKRNPMSSAGVFDKPGGTVIGELSDSEFRVARLLSAYVSSPDALLEAAEVQSHPKFSGLPEPVHVTKAQKMAFRETMSAAPSRFDTNTGLIINAAATPFNAVIAAAMIRSVPGPREILKAAFPVVWESLERRGVFQREADVVHLRNSLAWDHDNIPVCGAPPPTFHLLRTKTTTDLQFVTCDSCLDRVSPIINLGLGDDLKVQAERPQTPGVTGPANRPPMTSTTLTGDPAERFT